MSDASILKHNFVMEISITPHTVVTLPYHGGLAPHLEQPTNSRTFLRKPEVPEPQEDPELAHKFSTPCSNSSPPPAPAIIVPNTGENLDTDRSVFPRRITAHMDLPQPSPSLTSLSSPIVRNTRKTREFEFGWFQANGDRLPEYPPPFKPASPAIEGDIFLFKQIDGIGSRMWEWAVGQWVPISVGRVRKFQGRDREMNVKDDGTPSWILVDSAKRYIRKSKA